MIQENAKEPMFVRDLFDNQIEVTSISKAIEQVKMGCTTPYSITPFKLNKDGIQRKIKGRERELVPYCAYNEDMLFKLNLLNLDSDVNEVNIFFSQGGESLHCWETSLSTVKDFKDMSEAVCATGLVDEDEPVDFLICEANNADNEVMSGKITTRLY